MTGEQVEPLRQYDADGNVVWEGYPPDDETDRVAPEELRRRAETIQPGWGPAPWLSELLTWAAQYITRLEGQNERANLGLATTRELLEEIAARIHVSQAIGEEWTLGYRTVDREPAP